MLELLIARHGQSEWNALGRWQGHADPPLSEAGRVQAREAARALGRVDAVFASDLVRAASTAEIIAETLGVGPVMIDPGLRERDVGEWQGMTRAEIEVSYPGSLAAGDRPPGWEPDSSVRERVLRAIERIADEIGSGHVLVVAHGGVIYSLERHLGEEFAPIRNLHARWFSHRDGALALGERVALASDPSPRAAEA